MVEIMGLSGISFLPREGNVMQSIIGYRLTNSSANSEEAAGRAELAAVEEANRNAAGASDYP